MSVIPDEAETFKKALEEIAAKDILRTFTATDDNSESHWEYFHGPFAKIALAALGREIPMWIRTNAAI